MSDDALTSDDEVWPRRGRAQLLHRPDLGGVAATVRRLLAVQAQDVAAFPLALRARMPDATAAGVAAAREERAIVRTWGPRGTLHLVAAADLPWLFPLVRTSPAGSLRRLRELGVTADLDGAVRGVDRALAGQGPLSKAELGAALTRAGLPAEGQAIVHLAALGARAGLVVLGPDWAGRATYVHAADWLGAPLPVTTDHDRALAELALRYRRAHHPAEPADLAAWSGLPLREVTAGWRAAGDVEPVPAVDGHTDGGGDGVRLLPGYDEYLLGWRERPVAAAYQREVHPGGGVLRATVCVRGRIAGTWRARRAGAEMKITVDPFEPQPGAVVAAIAAEAADVGRFLGVPATVVVTR
ncbi:MAG TPA: winged helix DNA-binding domain-containing protein [Streptosporangiaceae bacterium]